MYQPRPLGRSGLSVPPVGFGCWALGGPFWAGRQPLGWGQADDQESVRALRRAFNAGIRLFDTADVYGTGHSERIVGRALAGHRDAAVIATKWGNTYDESRRALLGPDVSGRYARRALDLSLRRLGTDYVDIYQFHLADISPAAAAPLVGVLEDLVAAGKIRAYGWSTDDPGRAASWAGDPHAAVVQHRAQRAARRTSHAGAGRPARLGQHQPRPAGHGLAQREVHRADPAGRRRRARRRAAVAAFFPGQGRPSPGVAAAAGRGPGHPGQQRPVSRAGRAGLEPGPRPAHHPDPRLPHRGPGRGERGHAARRAADRRRTGRDRCAPWPPRRGWPAPARPERAGDRRRRPAARRARCCWSGMV